MKKTIDREGQLKKLGFEKDMYGQWSKNNFRIDNRTVKESSEAKWSNLMIFFR